MWLRFRKAGERIVVPTPALTELLVKAGDAGPKYLEIITRSKYFRVGEFGVLAAVEAAALEREARSKGPKRGATPEATWDKVKFDRQIVAIAKAVGAKAIYTNDDQLARHARAAELEVKTPGDLPEPPVLPQLEMRLEPIEPEQSIEDD